MKKLILRCDDFGCARGANTAIYELAKSGLTLNVSILVCGPEARSGLEHLLPFASRLDFGIHAAVTSEWDGIRWGPIGQAANATGLTDEQGFFLSHPQQISASLSGRITEEVRAQIEEALSWGVPFSYLDEHMVFSRIGDVRARLASLAAEFGLIYRPELPSLNSGSMGPPHELIHEWDGQLDAPPGNPCLLVTHPVRSDESTSRLFNATFPPGVVARTRENEFLALMNTGWQESLRRHQTDLTTYRDIEA